MLSSPRAYLVYAAGLLAVLEIMLFGAIWYWPTFMENIGGVMKLAKFSPILSEQVTAIEKGGVTAYVVGQHFFKGCSAVGVAGAILFAANSIASEAHRGTMEMWLARPVSRHRLYLERWLSGLLAVIVPVLISTATITPMMDLREIEETVGWVDLTRCALYMCAFLAPIYAATFAWSALSEAPLNISLTALFAAIVAFALYFVEVATDYTPFRLVDIRTLMAIIDDGAFDWRLLGPMLASTVILYVVGLRWFLRRTP